MIKRILPFFLLMLINVVAVAGKLESLVITNNGATTAILCTISGNYTQKSFALANPGRAVIDLAQTTTSINLKNVLLGQGLISRIRTGAPNNHTLRLVFDTKQMINVKTTLWQPANRSLHGLRIELTPAHASTAKYASPQSLAPVIGQKTQTQSHAVSKTTVARHVPPRAMRDVIVVIDPGHGGKDPGAMGMGRSVEKNVVLAISLKLKQLIDKQPGMRAVLTRDGDYYIELRERMNIARRYNADIFVAIHADAFINHNSNGASVFALSPRGATSEAARWLAEKENHSELGGVNLSGLDDQNGVIRTVLLDLSQTATIDASLQMGSRVLKGLDTITTLHNHKVEQARFMVLKSPDIPSILIETGFISNPREEKNLTNPAYQLRLTQAIFQGLKGYFWDYPPHGTRIEAMVGTNTRLAYKASSPQISSNYQASATSQQWNKRRYGKS